MYTQQYFSCSCRQKKLFFFFTDKSGMVNLGKKSSDFSLTETMKLYSPLVLHVRLL